MMLHTFLFVNAAAATAVTGMPSCEKKPETPLSKECKMFQEFEEKFEKEYEDDTKRLERYFVFLENLAEIEIMKLKDPSARYSHLTPLADMSYAEYSRRNNLHKQDTFDASVTPVLDELPLDDVPEKFDWIAKGGVNEVKDQGQCGSCWAFATVANIEGTFFNQGGKLYSLSEQELVSCDKTDQGCNGGLPSNAVKWLIAKHHGLELEKDYNYDGEDEPCTIDKSKERVFVNNWVQVHKGKEDQMAAALVKYGPLAIGINAMFMQFYFGGIANPPPMLCNPQQLDHGVTIVGYDEQDSQAYWIIRNSWGSGWGESGYYWIVRGSGACGLDQMVTTATETGTTPKLGEAENTKDSLEEMETISVITV